MTALYAQAPMVDDAFDGADEARAVVRRPGARELDGERYFRRERWVRKGLALIIPVAGLILWEVGARRGWIDVRFFSRPAQIVTTGRELVREGELQEQGLITVRRLLLGFGMGSLAGVLVGLVLSQFKTIRSLVEPLLRALYVIPKLAVLPILLLVFGLGEMPKVLFVALGVFFIVAFSSLSAASMVPTAYHEAGAAHGLTPLQRFRWIVLPGSLPQIVEALRLASGIGVLLVVAVEFVGASSGIGYLTWNSWSLFRADKMYVGIVVISIGGVFFSAAIGWIGKRLCPWSIDGR